MIPLPKLFANAELWCCVFVGTGTSGPMAARLALLRAQRQLYEDAGVHIHVRNLAVSLYFISNMMLPCPHHSVAIFLCTWKHNPTLADHPT